MAKERRSTEERRVEIADAALRLIASRGIAELTTRLVAEEVGLTTGALFRHFGSIGDILYAVVERVVDLLGGTYPPADLPPMERLGRFFRARTAAVGEHPGILRLVLSEQFALALPREAAQRLQDAVMRTRGFLVEAIREGQEQGAIRRDVAAEQLAMVVMGTMQMMALEAARGAEVPLGHGPEAPLGNGPEAAILRMIAAPSRRGDES